jgi:ureidoglycolate hydrolase
MTSIKVRELGPADSGWVRKVIPSGCAKPEADGPEFSYHQVLASQDLGGAGIIAELVCKQRPLVLEKMERHLRTPEILAALDADAVVCVAAPGCDPARCSPADIRAFLLKRGEAFWMEKGCWHWLPYPTDAAKVTLLLHFSEGTGDTDLEFSSLARPLAIALA